MKDYEIRIQAAYDDIAANYQAILNTAKDSKEGRDIMLKILHRECNVDKVVIMKWINANKEIGVKYDIQNQAVN